MCFIFKIIQPISIGFNIEFNVSIKSGIIIRSTPYILYHIALHFSIKRSKLKEKNCNFLKHQPVPACFEPCHTVILAGWLVSSEIGSFTKSTIYKENSSERDDSGLFF